MQTLAIIKPDATQRNLTGAINAVIEKAGLRIVAQKRVRWSSACDRRGTPGTPGTGLPARETR